MALINWDVHRWETDFAFSNLKDYLEMAESQFEAVREKERARTDLTPPAGLSEDGYHEWYSDYQGEVLFFEERYERDFPSKIRYSFIVLLHIVLEDRLRATCNEIQKRRNLPITEKDLRGAQFERVNAFLKKIAEIHYDNQKGWQELKDLQMIRDCIVHTNGRIEESRDKKRIYELCKKQIGVSDAEGALVVEKAYCMRSLETISAFFNGLLDSAGFGPCQITYS
ncbi:hypothetical protein GURASL_31140 [Geotalea uraniireducens]|uniref:RiboL-PSP-HEPN domain-containing protein n=1 Tax=Geotalea uraniireducens TaxID=351604 RepID=A0ABN6VV37_9BACT|nr:hypothetical protein [Geotalea uraniireducens]BDV44191.1 hypothetical protein GURASL_31140 [Geotalea uraniireducens]